MLQQDTRPNPNPFINGVQQIAPRQADPSFKDGGLLQPPEFVDGIAQMKFIVPAHEGGSEEFHGTPPIEAADIGAIFNIPNIKAQRIMDYLARRGFNRD